MTVTWKPTMNRPKSRQLTTSNSHLSGRNFLKSCSKSVYIVLLISFPTLLRSAALFDVSGGTFLAQVAAKAQSHLTVTPRRPSLQGCTRLGAGAWQSHQSDSVVAAKPCAFCLLRSHVHAPCLWSIYIPFSSHLSSLPSSFFLFLTTLCHSGLDQV